MQNTTSGRSTAGTDPFFGSPMSAGSQSSQMNRNGRQNGMNSMNWNMETAQSVGTISTKDLSILQDEMHSEALMYKKYSVYANYFNDPQLRNVAQQAAEHHKQHFECLQNYLNSSR